MSTLKVNTIQDASGSNSSTPAEIANGRAKAWGNISGNLNTPQFKDSYNCSSLTDNDTGDFTINFTNDITDNDYSFIATADNWEGSNTDSYCGVSTYNGSFATGSIRIKVLRWRWDVYQFKDSPNICFAVFR